VGFMMTQQPTVVQDSIKPAVVRYSIKWLVHSIHAANGNRLT
jgi:hypothetical protein